MNLQYIFSMAISINLFANYNIYIYAFSRRFYPKRLIQAICFCFFVSMCVPWELNPQPSALLMQCSTTEPQELIICVLAAFAQVKKVVKINICCLFLSMCTLL